MTDTERSKPIVIRREDGSYVVHGIPSLDTLSPGQRVGYGMLVWDQIKTLMDANDEATYPPVLVDEKVALTMQCARTSVNAARTAMKRDGWKYLDQLIEGTLHQELFLRKAGLVRPLRLKTGPLEVAKDGQTYYGKGDHFDEASEPLRRYLKAWEKRGFEFRHVPPREAQRRLRRIGELVAHLAEAQRDLEGRSHLATSRAPQERKERRR